MWVAMLLNKGHHPTTNETVVPEDVVDHVALGVSVSRGKADYPELVSFNLLVYPVIGVFHRAQKYTAVAKTVIRTAATR
jgi:hypothetical protein